MNDVSTMLPPSQLLHCASTAVLGMKGGVLRLVPYCQPLWEGLLANVGRTQKGSNETADSRV